MYIILLIRSCVDVNECTGNPCGGGAICDNLIGSYSCACPRGTDGDPYKNCNGRAVGGCASDSECNQVRE